MEEILIYTIKVGICLVVFYLFFKLLLARETFHRLNRFMILGMVILSFLLPVCVITIERVVPGSSPLLFPADGINAPIEEKHNSWLTWQNIVGVIYLTGILVSLAGMVKSLFQLRKIIKGGERRKLENGACLILTNRHLSPFSWGKYIVMSYEDWRIAGDTILLHEQAHVRLHHTLDIMLTDLLGSVQWFNPAMWLLRKELRDIHEYEADAAVIESGVNPKEYQLLLIKKAVGGRWYSIANSFNHNKLKNRINMMLQKKSTKMARAKSLLILPLLCLAVVAFAETTYVSTDDKVNEKQEKSDTLRGKTIRISTDGKDVDLYKNALILVNGEKVESLDNLNPETIESITVCKDPKEIKELSKTMKLKKKDLEGKSGIIAVTLKDPDSPKSDMTVDMTIRANSLKDPMKNVLILVDGKKVETLDNVHSETIESMTVVKDKEQMKVYGKDAEGKDGVIVITLKK